MKKVNYNILLDDILAHYRHSFNLKEMSLYKGNDDILMEIFSISNEKKLENMQYWGRELGMCWQKIVVSFCKFYCGNRFSPPLQIGDDEPNDLFIDRDAIDTKYRVGSGDSGTLKKFKLYGKELTGRGFNPIALILREDNLDAAITALNNGGWKVFTGDDSFNYIKNKTGHDLKNFLSNKIGLYSIK